MRPHAIDGVLPALERLACAGALPADSEHAPWLVRVGAVHSGAAGPWRLMAPGWAEAALPARDGLDLLLRTALRDPLYRFHVDVLVCRVLQSVAASGRWARLEELLQGPFANFVPRFVQMLEWCAWASGCRTHQLNEQAWEEASRRVEGEHGMTFAGWDRHLWGDVAGGAAALFPSLEGAYAPLAAVSVNVNAVAEEMNTAEERLLAALVERSRHGEGAPVRPESSIPLEGLRMRGLPIRVWPAGPGAAQRQPWAAVVGPVCMATTQAHVEAESEGAPLAGLDREALRRSRVVTVAEAGPTLPGEGLWGLGGGAGAVVACIGLEPGRATWPGADEALPAPVGYQVPGSEALRGVRRPRSLSPEADEALLLLGQHFLFGALLQVLLVEALDRELGSEALTLASPEAAEEADEAVRVLYAPHPEGDEASEAPALPVYDLGGLDAVLAKVALDIGLCGAAVVYAGGARGAWSAGLRLLRLAGLVTRRPERITLADEALDRLHGGGLMSGVLRRGRHIRQQIHETLRRLWEQAHARAVPREARHV